MNQKELQDIFTYHAATIDQVECYNKINDAFLKCAEVINEVLPEGPGKTVAIRKLSEARMQSNHCFSLDGKF